MELSWKRIDDAPEVDVHSSRFVTVTAPRVCAGAWTNVHHTLVSVWRKRKCERRSSRRPIPKYRRHHRPIDSAFTRDASDLGITKRENCVWKSECER
jgi:hypothetical protein